MSKKLLPLEKLTEREFFDWRKIFLDNEKLGAESLTEIRRVFGLSGNGVISVDCNEHHQHGYPCYDFSNRDSAVVLRLLDEIASYRTRLDMIRHRTNYEPEPRK